MKVNKSGQHGNELGEIEPIFDLECERMVLVSLMSAYSTFADCEPILTEDCFHDLHHQEIFRALKSLFQRGDGIDVVSVKAELKKMESNVSATELAKLVTGTELTYTPIPRAERLRDLSYRRKIWELGVAMAEQSRNESYDLDVVYNGSKKAIDEIFSGVSSGIETLEETYRGLQELMLLNRDREPGTIRGTPTGFSWFDDRGGLIGTNLMIIGADTSQGKTSLATAMVVSAIKHGHGVAVYSMEMTPTQIASRIASMETGISSNHIQNDSLEIGQIYMIDDAMSKIDMSKLYFDGRSTSSLDTVMSSIRQLKNKYGIKGAVVDYLQLVKIENKALTREQQVAKSARDLKNLAKELDIWIIALSQISRGDRGNPVPSMAMLRDSGQIEEAADVVVLIYRPSNGKRFPAPYQDVDPTGKALIKIEKGRNIGVGEFICGFKPESTLFYPLNPMELEFSVTASSSGNVSTTDPFEEEVPF